MVGFNGILSTGQTEECKMMKGKLMDGLNCEQGQGQISEDD